MAHGTTPSPTSSRARSRRQLLLGLAFLSPNILGFLAFTLLPLVFSLVLAFSNWDLKLHNRFKDNSIRFVGLDNFVRLFEEPYFLQFLGNTLFLMLGIPFAIAGSLMAAVLLSKETSGGGGRVLGYLVASAVLIGAVLVLLATGMGGSAMIVLLAGLGGCVLLAGVVGGTTIYRTLFYTPHFTAGVATYLLWKKMYAPQDGPINNALGPLLGGVGEAVRALPAALISVGGVAVCLVGIAGLLGLGLRRLRVMWRDGDAGHVSLGLALAFLLLAPVLAVGWWPGGWPPVALGLVTAGLLAWQGVAAAKQTREFEAPALTQGLGSAAMFALALMVGLFVLVGLARVLWFLPTMAATGLEPPGWIHDYDWAKPALIMMGLWAAIGSNNMLLYLAALTNVPGELYEASDIDGAGRFARFWHVTWPQLAPTTFFIVIMSMIAGLQGGFEMARTMTAGGPAGATTMLSYFIYIEGFETGRLGYASAISWALFAMVFVVTLINWKFGNRYVND